jgi:hypothetical protein
MASALHNGMGWKRRMRVQKAASLTALGLLSDKDIAAHIGITPAAFSVLKGTQQFKQAMIELSTGIIAQDTQAVARSHVYQKEEIADMVPLALQNLRNLALSNKPELRLKASLEILDRDGKHSKVSRTSVTVEQHVDLSTTNNIANNILGILRSQAPEQIPSDMIIDAEDVASKAMNEFTRSASDADKQVEQMAETITEDTLKIIEASTKTIQ